MWSRSGFSLEPAAASGLKPLRHFPRLDLRTFLLLASAFSQSHLAILPKITPQDHPNAGNETSRPQSPDASRARLVRGRKRGRKCQTMRKQELMFAILKQLAI